MQLVDQYVYKCDMPLAQYQLLGVACLLIASKFEERFPPAVRMIYYSFYKTFVVSTIFYNNITLTCV